MDEMSDRIVKATVKDALSDHNVSADFYDALNEGIAGEQSVYFPPA